jgi:type IV secretory pathway VirB6-like protein
MSSDIHYFVWISTTYVEIWKCTLAIVFKNLEESISNWLALQNWININLYFLVLNYTNIQGKQK